MLKRLAFANHRLQAFREKGADGPAFLGGQNSSLAQEILIQAESDIRFHKITCITVLRVWRPLTIPPACVRIQ